MPTDTTGHTPPSAPSSLEALVAVVEADVLAAEGPYHIGGVYHAASGDADIVRRRLATRTAADVERVRAWARRGATVDGCPIRPTATSQALRLFDRCAWCGLRFTRGAATVALAGRLLHDTACREAFDQFVYEAEIERAHAVLCLVEAST